MYTYLNLCSPLRHRQICDAQPLPKVSILLSPTATHWAHTTFTLHYSSSIVLDCRRAFNLISWTKSHQLLPMGPDSQGNKQEFSGLRRQQPSCGHQPTQPLFTLCPMHLVIFQMWSGMHRSITFVVPLQISHRISVSTCSAMHFRWQLIMGVNGNLFWVTTCGWILWNIR